MVRSPALVGADSRGAGLVEYVVLAGMIGILALGGIRAFGTSGQSKVAAQASCIAALDPGCAGSDEATRGAAAPTRREKVDAVTTSAKPGHVQLAYAGIGDSLLQLVSALSPISTAQAAEAPREPREPRVDPTADGNRIADAIVRELRQRYPGAEIGAPAALLSPRTWMGPRNMWGESWGNELPSGALVQSPPASHWGRPSAELGRNHSDFLYDEVYRSIAQARERVAFATLASPDGSYVDEIRRALADLHGRQTPGSAGVDVRILIGLADDGVDAQGRPRPAGTTVRQILDELTRELPAGSPVRVSVGTYGGPDQSRLASWSHAKMIVSDGQEALVGGHNWWVGDYNQDNPVHDVSVRVRGPAARQAEAYFDELWSHTVTNGRVAARGGPPSVPAGRPPLAAGRPGEGVRILSVGAPGGHFMNVNTAAPADAAILTMIRSAQRSVRLSQQELVSQALARPAAEAIGMGAVGRTAAAALLPQHIAPALLDELALAVLRGVNVDVVLTGTDPSGDTQGYSHGWTAGQTRAAIVDHIHANRARLTALLPRDQRASPSVVDQRLRDNLDIRELRFSDEASIDVNGKQQPLRNHAKVIIVDDAAAYIGSQNLYPGGLASRPPIQQLGEFGYIVVGPRAAGLLLDDYWNRMWPLSVRRP